MRAWLELDRVEVRPAAGDLAGELSTGSSPSTPQ